MDSTMFVEQCGVPCFRFDLGFDESSNAPWVANRQTRISLPAGRVIRVQITDGEHLGEVAMGVVTADGSIVGRTPFGATHR